MRALTGCLVLVLSSLLGACDSCREKPPARAAAAEALVEELPVVDRDFTVHPDTSRLVALLGQEPFDLDKEQLRKARTASGRVQVQLGYDAKGLSISSELAISPSPTAGAEHYAVTSRQVHAVLQRRRLRAQPCPDTEWWRQVRGWGEAADCQLIRSDRAVVGLAVLARKGPRVSMFTVWSPAVHTKRDEVGRLVAARLPDLDGYLP